MQIGYLSIVILMTLSPIPPEAFMPLAGILVAQNKLNFAGVVATGVLGYLLSVLPWYLAGRYLGQEGLYKHFNRKKGLIKFSAKKLKQVNRWFNQYGEHALLFSFLIPGIHNIIAIPAGTSGMSLPLFITYSTIGSTIWLSALTFAGYFLGDRYYLVEQHFDVVSRVAIASLIFLACIWLAKRYWSYRAKSS